MFVNTKQHAHKLVEQLAPSQHAAVVHLLEVMIQEEEPVTDEDRRCFYEVQDWFAERNRRCNTHGRCACRVRNEARGFAFREVVPLPYRIDWLEKAKADARESGPAYRHEHLRWHSSLRPNRGRRC